MRRTFLVLLVGVGVFLTLASAQASPTAPARPASNRTVERITSGNVTAELSYLKKRVAGVTRYRSKRIRIIRDGVPLRDEPVPSRCDSFCSPARVYQHKKSISFHDIDGDGDPEVLVDFFTGGANCCFYTLAYSHYPLYAHYLRSAGDFGHYGYKLRDIERNGTLQFVSRDSRFYGLFSCGACGPLPIQVRVLSGQNIADDSLSYPTTIRRDSRRVYRAYLRKRRLGIDFVRGYLNAYVADQCLLRKCRTGFRAVERARRQGRLKKRARLFEFGPYGRSYARKLKRVLVRYHYFR